jgi:hypothetical protein
MITLNWNPFEDDHEPPPSPPGEDQWTCRCTPDLLSGKEQFQLSIACGNLIELVHVPCGRPWPIPEELEDSLCLDNLPVTLELCGSGPEPDADRWLDATWRQ